MGRAIVREPQAFLMDEPLSNLDAKLRVQTRAEIARLQADLNVTTIYVTHDQVEAMTMGDRVAVMRKGGELQQAAAPQELYDHPVNLFVAGFIGSPAMNVLEAELDAEHVALKVGAARAPLSEAVLERRPGLEAYAGKPVILGIRPEGLEDAAVAREEGVFALDGEVALVEALGSELMVHFTVDARPALTAEVRELAEEAGDDRTLAADAPPPRATLVGRFDPRSRVKVGDNVKVTVDADALHFFDPETNLAIYDKPK
jgi:multiple sugar transport system ATP-binding protein